MKGNNGSGNIIERDDWETPQWLFDKLNKEYYFGVDCCATPKNSKCNLCPKDFLKFKKVTEFDYVYWMNPPFSKAFEMFKHFFKVVDEGVAIFRCDNMETKIWQEVIFPKADWVFIPNKRISYEHSKRKMNGSRFPSALIGKGVKPPIYLKGTLLRINEENKSEARNDG